MQRVLGCVDMLIQTWTAVLTMISKPSDCHVLRSSASLVLGILMLLTFGSSALADNLEHLECGEGEYARVSQEMISQLNLKFTKSQKKGLAKRRAQLRKILSETSPECAIWFRRGLERRSSLEYSRLFHSKLAGATRRSLLSILDAQVGDLRVKAPSSPEKRGRDTDSKSGSIDKYQHLLHAVAELPDEDRRKPEFLCWMGKLSQSQIDDRLIEWPKVCNRESVGWLDGSPYNGSCLLMGGGYMTESAMFETFHSIGDVDRYQGPNVMTRLKRDLILADRDESLALYSLSLLHKNVKRTMEVLFEWEGSDAGFNTMPDYYEHIAAWIKQKQNSKESVYSCL